MTDREKLANLLHSGRDNYFLLEFEANLLAAHLMKHGVVVREWIPVTERVPERDGCYIVTVCDEGCPYGEGIWYDTVVVMADYYDDGRWVWYEGVTEYDLCDFVTHWMPLPEPPMRKGENG